MDKENVAHTHSGIFFSHNKEKNVILSFAKTWVACEKSQTEKGKHYIHYIVGDTSKSVLLKNDMALWLLETWSFGERWNEDE